MTTVGVTEIIANTGNGETVGVSDGYFKEYFGTVSWVIENLKGTVDPPLVRRTLYGHVHCTDVDNISTYCTSCLFR